MMKKKKKNKLNGRLGLISQRMKKKPKSIQLDNSNHMGRRD
jgi:hypothetical protein